MSSPMVVAVMLANGRERMVKRAIASFEAQTYENKKLLVLDTGDDSVGYLGDHDNVIHHWCDLSLQSWSIGLLRNEAIRRVGREGPDLICHWDSDDWSHPRRIEEQVALLQASGKECVGYRELLFWDTRPIAEGCDVNRPARGVSLAGGLTTRQDAEVVHGIQDLKPQQPSAIGRSWLLSLPDPRVMVGASMMYTVDAWRRHPFCDGPRPGADGKLADYEDNHWLAHNNARTLGVTAKAEPVGDPGQASVRCDPRMICAIHGDRQSGSYDPATMQKAKEWRRVPEWDSYCAGTMKL